LTQSGSFPSKAKSRRDRIPLLDGHTTSCFAVALAARRSAISPIVRSPLSAGVNGLKSAQKDSSSSNSEVTSSPFRLSKPSTSTNGRECSVSKSTALPLSS